MFLFPMIPNLYKVYNNCDLPPTLYALLNSKLNFDSDEKTKIRDLAREGRTFIFDFDYPLAEHWDKEEFETMIINHFLMRRIGYETFTAFEIALQVKINEIMPMYNKLFESIYAWDLFRDGENITRDGTDNRTNVNVVNNTTNSSSQDNGSSSSNRTGQNTSSNTSDQRHSDTPQNQIADVRDGKYVSDYNYNQDNGSLNTSESESTTTSNTNTSGSTSNTRGDTQDDLVKHETIVRTPHDKISIYKEFLTEKQNLYTMIFKDLDCLFFQIIT